MTTTPSQSDFVSVLSTVRGFRFHPQEKAIKKTLQPLLACGEFTQGPPTPQPCPLAEYRVRFDNNAVVLLKALLFFKEYSGYDEFFGFVQQCIPSLVNSGKRLELAQKVLCSSRKGHLNVGGSSERSELTALVSA